MIMLLKLEMNMKLFLWEQVMVNTGTANSDAAAI